MRELLKLMILILLPQMCCRRAGGEFFAHNQVNDIAQAGVGHPSVGDVGTFIHHHDPVADQEQVLQVVGNQNHAHPGEVEPGE